MPKLSRHAEALGTENAFVVLAEVNRLIRLAADDGRVPAAARRDYWYGLLERVSQVAGLVGIGLLIWLSRRTRRPLSTS